MSNQEPRAKAQSRVVQSENQGLFKYEIIIIHEFIFLKMQGTALD